jgi:uncharacterized protein (DUF2267 family)
MAAMQQTFSEIIQRACELGPFADEAAAARTFLAVVKVASRSLRPEERQVLAASLPVEVGPVLRHPEPARPCDLDSLVNDLAAAEGIGAGLALEHLAVAGRALAEALPPAGRALLMRALPDLSRLLEPRDEPEPVHETSEWPAGTPHDLAEGRQGGRHPLASSDPSRLAHQHSIARSDDPHGDSKLSGARGLSQEREAETLATGKPGSRRPLSSSH